MNSFARILRIGCVSRLFGGGFPGVESLGDGPVNRSRYLGPERELFKLVWGPKFNYQLGFLTSYNYGIIGPQTLFQVLRPLLGCSCQVSVIRASLLGGEKKEERQIDYCTEA